MDKILITGATGNIGTKLVDALLAKKADLRVGVRTPAKASHLLDKQVEVVELDFMKPGTFAEAFSGVGSAFLLLPFVEDFTTPAKQALEAAKAAGVKFVVKLSAIGADPEAPLHASEQHGLSDQATRESGMDWCILQPSFFMDNFVNFAGMGIKSSGQFYGASGVGRSAYVSSGDIARAAAAIFATAADHRGQTYVLTGPESLTDSEVAGKISEVTGKPASFVNVPPDQLSAAMVQNGMPQWMADDLAGLEGVKAGGWAAQVSRDYCAITGRPAERLADFLAAHKDAFV